jgi:hypothetical protein
MVTSMKGALLTETTLLELMLVAARSLPGGRGWVSLEAERVGDGTGVVVSLRLQGSNGSGTSGGGLCWAAQLGENMLRAAAGSGVRDMYDDVSDFDDQRKEIATVLAASRTTPFLVQLHLRWD